MASSDDHAQQKNRLGCLLMNRRNILAFALGPLMTAFLGLVTLPITAWIFPPADIGRNSVFQVVIAFSLLFFVLGLDQAYVREYHESSKRSALLKACFAPGLLLLTASAALLVPFSVEISWFLYGDDNPVWAWLTFACVFLNFVARFLSLILRMQERGLAFSLSQVAPKLLMVCVLFGYLYFDVEKVYTSLLVANLISVLAVTLTLLWNVRAEVRCALWCKISLLELRPLLSFGLPLIAAGVAYWGLKATSTLVLRMSGDFEELAVYSLALSFGSAATVFQTIFSTVWMPTVYKWVASNRDLDLVESVNGQLVAVVGAILMLSSMLSWAVDYFLPPVYAEVKYLLPACMLPPLYYTLSETTVVGLNIQRKTGYSVVIALIAFLVNFSLCFLLAGQFGAVGVASVNALAFFVFTILRTEFSRRVWRPLPRAKMYVSSGVYLLFSIFFATYQPTRALEWSVMVSIGVIYIGVVHRADLANAWSFVFKKTRV